MQPFVICGGIFAVSVTFAAIFLLWKLLHAVQQLAGNNAATLEQLAGNNAAILEQLAGLRDAVQNTVQNNAALLDAVQKMQCRTRSSLQGCAKQSRTFSALELARSPT